MSENLLLHRRPQAPPAAERASSPRPRTSPPAAAIAIGATATATEFAARNSPVDLLFRALWQLVGVYVFLVLVVKDRRLPRRHPAPWST